MALTYPLITAVSVGVVGFAGGVVATTNVVNSVRPKFPLLYRPGPPVGKPLLESLMTFRKIPVIGSAELTSTVIVYTSVAGTGPVVMICPGAGNVNIVPFSEVAPIIVKGVS